MKNLVIFLAMTLSVAAQAASNGNGDTGSAGINKFRCQDPVASFYLNEISSQQAKAWASAAKNFLPERNSAADNADIMKDMKRASMACGKITVVKVEQYVSDPNYSQSNEYLVIQDMGEVPSGMTQIRNSSILAHIKGQVINNDEDSGSTENFEIQQITSGFPKL